MDQEPVERYTMVFSTITSAGEPVVVVVPGEHDTDASDWCGLDHELIPAYVTNDGLVVIDDPQISEEVLGITLGFLYMTEGERVTSKDTIVQITPGNNQIEIAEFGPITITPVVTLGVANKDSGEVDRYQVALANPTPGVYLVVLLEIIGIDPIVYRAFDLENDDLIDTLLETYLVEIGAINEVLESEDEC